jgi:NAD(P)H-hydrate epimerase
MFFTGNGFTKDKIIQNRKEKREERGIGSGELGIREEGKRLMDCEPLVSADNARALDAEASASWGLNAFSLVEAAGRACAENFIRALKPGKYKRYVALAGSGNNAADALVMLKTLVLDGYARISDCSVLVTRQHVHGENTPLSMALLAIEKIGVPVEVWDKEKSFSVLAGADFIVDGITGTGLKDPLKDTALVMTEAANSLHGGEKPFIVSIDVPSGNFDGWKNGMPIIRAGATLAIQPQKMCLYAPAARVCAGEIIPVNGIFPRALTEKYRGAQLVSWHSVSKKVPSVADDAYKYKRGLVEIRAGSTGATGAALLASLGAQAAGAGLVRLVVDPSIYPVIAPACKGVMAVSDPGISPNDRERFSPSAVLLGPGWGKTEDRKKILESFLPLEKNGRVPLVLDADAIHLAKNIVFSGNVILTPHTGEFAGYTGLSKDEILGDTVKILKAFSVKNNVNILFKSHVMYIASPDGRIGIIDGMNPLLACGGSGDVLAGFCAAIAARLRETTPNEPFDGYACACAAASIAGAAWLRQKP